MPRGLAPTRLRNTGLSRRDGNRYPEREADRGLRASEPSSASRSVSRLTGSRYTSFSLAFAFSMIPSLAGAAASGRRGGGAVGRSAAANPAPNDGRKRGKVHARANPIRLIPSRHSSESAVARRSIPFAFAFSRLRFPHQSRGRGCRCARCCPETARAPTRNRLCRDRPV